MKSRKTQGRKQRLNARLLVGLLVAAAIVVVVGAKIATSLRLAATTALSGAPSSTPQASIGPQPAATVPGAAGIEPFPSSPAAQVDWVTRNKMPAMILYHSTNCIPCKAMDELVKKVRADYEPDVVFVDVITNNQANLIEIRRAKIQVIPTTFFVSASGEIKKQVGAMPEDALRAELARLLAGD